MSLSKQVAIAWAMAAAWAGLIFCMSAQSGTDLSNLGGILGDIKRWIENAQLALFGSDVDLISSTAHFLEYTALGALLARAIALTTQQTSDRKAEQKRTTWRLICLAAAIASLYGITDEIHQIFVPGRFCDPVDWIVDTAGALLGAAVSTTAAQKPIGSKSH